MNSLTKSQKQTDHMAIRARLVNTRNKLARFYDNGGPNRGGTFDRYTAVYLKPMIQKDGTRYSPDSFAYAGMSTEPFHPQGFGQHGESDRGPADFPPCRLGGRNHLGKRIRFADLPPDCQKLVLQDLAED
jgi:hypothetical protein